MQRHNPLILYNQSSELYSLLFSSISWCPYPLTLPNLYSLQYSSKPLYPPSKFWFMRMNINRSNFYACSFATHNTSTNSYCFLLISSSNSNFFLISSIFLAYSCAASLYAKLLTVSSAISTIRNGGRKDFSPPTSLMLKYISHGL